MRPSPSDYISGWRNESSRTRVIVRVKVLPRTWGSLYDAVMAGITIALIRSDEFTTPLFIRLLDMRRVPKRPVGRFGHTFTLRWVGVSGRRDVLEQRSHLDRQRCGS